MRKVLPIDLLGEPDISSPLAFVEGLFYYEKKEGFYKSFVVLI
jgi:hypothetical protein